MKSRLSSRGDPGAYPDLGACGYRVPGKNRRSSWNLSRCGIAKIYLIAFAGSLVMGYVLAHAIVASAYFRMSGMTAGLMSGFWNWLGFVAPVTLGAVLWEGKPWKLWVLTNGYYLVSLLIMGAILSVWK